MKKIGTIFFASVFLLIGCAGGRNADYCVVKGSINGVDDGARLELQDFWNHCKVVAAATVKDGAFEFHPAVKAPTRVFLYQGDSQLQDFFLEPGTICVDVDAAEGDEYGPSATGTPSNDALYRYRTLDRAGLEDEARAFADSIFAENPTGPLAVMLADNYDNTPAVGAEALERLSPELSGLSYVEDLKERLSLLAKTQPTPGYRPQYIDMEYADVAGNPVRLSSVVGRNRYVLLDFWATWCGPCVRYLPNMKEIYAKYHGKGLEIYSVSIDTNEKRWKSFLKENGMDWISVRDNLAGLKASGCWQDYAITTIPMFLLIDCSNGEILFRENHPDLESVFSGLLP